MGLGVAGEGCEGAAGWGCEGDLGCCARDEGDGDEESVWEVHFEVGFVWLEYDCKNDGIQEVLE